MQRSRKSAFSAEGTARAKSGCEQAWNVQGKKEDQCGWSLVKDSMVWKRGCERSKLGPVQRYVSHGEELGFYSKVNGKTLEGFPLGSDMMQFIFSKYPGFCVEDVGPWFSTMGGFAPWQCLETFLLVTI